MLSFYQIQLIQCIIITYPLISKLRECVHNNTKYDVETNSCDNDEE